MATDLNLHSVCHYRGSSEGWGKWEDNDYKAWALVKAVKGLPFKGRYEFRMKNGHSNIVDSSDAGRRTALRLAVGTLAPKVRAAGYDKVAVIPVPSSSHVDPSADFTGLRIAHVMREHTPDFTPAPILYLDQVLAKSSSAGGSRNSYEFEGHLRFVDGPRPERAVLLDDVCTTGGHLKAAARFLAKHGITVTDAFVVGRTALERPPHMFRVPTETIQIANPFGF